ncbi:multicopper oxidase domain-containing protein [Pseudomonas sp. CBSPBW29]|uniref:multicopper oxidase family protein n=1 Tax=Pseudomonas TaxID=286 RepID=UPI0021AC8E49|nr:MULTISPECIES: multicopper oxidase domain-containing protein [unclassified Pseudomonas]WEL44756.1 multicopper oxidase domain-containing protein [Pseudomonas sp. CBSPBW29]WEL65851.1 multicopper oxidase domain-containing protein [Pseudomonas sp. CBSPGW29]WEL69320.1 multicopper oxidase domain-containing protein [Pseudomonas sp. CBSPCGW29]WEL76309.1 multicopper oxidase domain-containing protein [Pseudomonas sp. CBSPAW29]WEL87907.1 multicopper oxidase domain-containing protein [Pseudomonas sp. CB
MNGLIAIKACAASVCVVLLSSLLSPGMSLAQTTTHAASKGASIAPIPGGCPRFEQGAQVVTPPALYSQNGTLAVSFSYQQSVDAKGRTLYCFMTPDGMQNPTLHVLPGDKLTVVVTNNTPAGVNPMTLNPPNCGAKVMNSTSVNLHYHGTNTAPVCGGDEVIKTIINSGETFTYTLDFPTNEPPGMYWYHPHVHGISDPVVMGGATGALIVDGIERFFPGVEGLPQQVLVLRDQRQLNNLTEGPGNCGVGVPFHDVTVNNVPVNSYTDKNNVFFIPATLPVSPGEAQFWRIANISADSILDLSLVYDNVPQTLNLIAIDGVPINSQDGTGGSGQSVPVNHFRLPPASRVEFVANMPAANVQQARLMTANINTGADGDCNPTRPLITLNPATKTDAKLAGVPARPIPEAAGRRFAGLAQASVVAQRNLYFSENADQSEFYMTVDGQVPHVFNPDQPPSITTTQGTVEQWSVENRSTENHVFHIHQIHFYVQGQNNFGQEPQAPGIVGQYLDTIEVPAWSGNAQDAYPSVSLLMDFRGEVVGDFVFHCHLLGHEDLGMMSIIRVNPASGKVAQVASSVVTAPSAGEGHHMEH